MGIVHEHADRMREGRGEEKLELSVTPTRKLWLAEGSRWPGSQTSVEYHMRALDELVSVEPDDTLKAAAKKMNRAGVSGAPRRIAA